jgi:hypothetical protein
MERPVESVAAPIALAVEICREEVLETAMPSGEARGDLDSMAQIPVQVVIAVRHLEAVVLVAEASAAEVAVPDVVVEADGADK